MKEENSSSWFIYIKKLLHKYNLPLHKFWKNRCHRKISGKTPSTQQFTSTGMKLLSRIARENLQSLDVTFIFFLSENNIQFGSL